MFRHAFFSAFLRDLQPPSGGAGAEHENGFCINTKGANMKKSFLLFQAILILFLLSLIASACSDDGDESESDGDVSESDAEGQSDGDDESSDGDTADGDESGGDTEEADGDGEAPTEFSFRVPRTDAYICEDPNMGDTEMSDLDHLCQIKYEELDLELYVQSTPTSCVTNFWPMPVYESEAWIKRDGAVSKLDGVSYDFGGNHHNDWLNFVLDGRNYQLWHSSIGIGWRRCAPVDCMLVCREGMSCSQEGEESAIEVNGCEREPGSGAPPIPVICMEIPADGSRPDFIDPWQPWEGDEYYPLLPCDGEEDVMTR